VCWIATSPHEPEVVLGIELGGLMRTEDVAPRLAIVAPTRPGTCIVWRGIATKT
jgi:hypothetical protein